MFFCLELGFAQGKRWEGNCVPGVKEVESGYLGENLRGTKKLAVVSQSEQHGDLKKGSQGFDACRQLRGVSWRGSYLLFPLGSGRSPLPTEVSGRLAETWCLVFSLVRVKEVMSGSVKTWGRLCCRLILMVTFVQECFSFFIP